MTIDDQPHLMLAVIICVHAQPQQLLRARKAIHLRLRSRRADVNHSRHEVYQLAVLRTHLIVADLARFQRALRRLCPGLSERTVAHGDILLDGNTHRLPPPNRVRPSGHIRYLSHHIQSVKQFLHAPFSIFAHKETIAELYRFSTIQTQVVSFNPLLLHSSTHFNFCQA